MQNELNSGDILTPRSEAHMPLAKKPGSQVSIEKSY